MMLVKALSGVYTLTILTAILQEYVSLAIADGYATDMYSLLAALSSQVNYLDANSDTAATEAVVDDLEAFLGGISYGKTICEALITGATAGTFANATHLHDPAKCYGFANAAGANSTLEAAAGALRQH